MLAFCESLAETMFKFTNIVMYMAPIGVGAAVAYTVAHTGIGVFGSLLKLLLTLYVALIVFVLAVLLPTALMFGVPLKRFAKAVAEPVTIAFATSSSEAALPRAMEAMEAIGVPRQIVAFVIPTGYSFNLTGSSLYLSVAAIFVAQVAGMHLSLGQQLLIMLTLMLTSKGVAGRLARGAGDPAGDGDFHRTAHRTSVSAAGSRSVARHGTHRRECARQLPGDSGDGEVGG